MHKIYNKYTSPTELAAREELDKLNLDPVFTASVINGNRDSLDKLIVIHECITKPLSRCGKLVSKDSGSKRWKYVTCEKCLGNK